MRRSKINAVKLRRWHDVMSWIESAYFFWWSTKSLIFMIFFFLMADEPQPKEHEGKVLIFSKIYVNRSPSNRILCSFIDDFLCKLLNDVTLLIAADMLVTRYFWVFVWRRGFLIGT